MHLNETYCRVRVGKYLSDMFPFRDGLKEGDALSPYFSNFALEYAIRRVQVSQDGVKYQLLFYVDPNVVEDIKIRRQKWAVLLLIPTCNV
jgi:hypothetical protein